LTLASAVLISVLLRISGMSAGAVINMDEYINDTGIQPIMRWIVLAGILASAFLLLFMTKLKVPMADRKGDEKGGAYIAAYVFSALAGCLTGVAYIFRYRAVVPLSVSGDYIFAVFIIVCLYATRLMDNRAAVLPYTLMMTVAYGYISISMNMMNISSYMQSMLLFILIAATALVAGLRWRENGYLRNLLYVGNTENRGNI